MIKLLKKYHVRFLYVPTRACKLQCYQWRAYVSSGMLCKLAEAGFNPPSVNINHWILTWVDTLWNDKNEARCYFLLRKIPQSWQMHYYHKQSQDCNILSRARHKQDHLINRQQHTTVSPFANFHYLNVRNLMFMLLLTMAYWKIIALINKTNIGDISSICAGNLNALGVKC